MIAHHKPVQNICKTIFNKVLKGEQFTDPHQGLELLRVMCSPNDVPYALNQDHLYCDLEDSFTEKTGYLSKYRFLYKNSQIYIKNEKDSVETSLKDFSDMPVDEKKFIIDYMKMIAAIADMNIMPWLKP